MWAISQRARDGRSLYATFSGKSTSGALGVTRPPTVVLEGVDRNAVAALVEHAVTTALSGVLGGEEAGWTAQPWEAIPAESS
jgi:hypothetical protein